MSLAKRINAIKINLDIPGGETLAARECLTLVEVVLRQLFAKGLTKLDFPDRRKVQDAEHEIGKGEKGIQDFTMGQLVGVFRTSNFLDAWSRTTGKDVTSIQMINLNVLNTLRNAFVHDGREAKRSEAEFLFNCLQVFLDTFDISDHEDSNVEEPTASFTSPQSDRDEGESTETPPPSSESQYDIFVSYAPSEREWLKPLAQILKSDLSKQLGDRDASIQMAYDLSHYPSQPDEVEQALSNSKVLLIVLSPDYIDAALTEARQQFLGMIQRRGDRGKIFIIKYGEYDDASDTDWLSQFPSSREYRFEPGMTPQNPDYHSRLLDLNEALLAELNRLSDPHVSDSNTSKPSIFLAEITDDLDDEHADVQRYLKRLGYRVLPERQYPIDPDGFQQEVDKDLSECFLFVQLLSDRIGKKPQGLPLLQYQCARNRSMSILQWRDREVQVSSESIPEEHRDLLLGETVLAVDFEEFKATVVKRAEDLQRQEAERLEAERLEAEKPEDAPQRVKPNQTMTVFLAEPTDDLEEEHEQILDYLEELGCRILPNGALPAEADTLQRSVQQDLKQCALFVQLLSDRLGRKPRGLPFLQYQCAANWEMPVVQWRLPEIDLGRVRDSEHRSLLAGDTVLEDFETFKHELKKGIIPEEPDKRDDDDIVTNAAVFVNSHQKDTVLERRIVQELQKKGVTCFTPLREGTPQEIQDDLENLLQECEALVIVYGEVPPTWVRRQVMHTVKSRASLRTLTVLEGPPGPKRNIEIHDPKIKILQGHEGLSEDTLRSLVDTLRG